MESEELRELTASERLSLQEEYNMQEKWRNDTDKCTFIVLDRAVYDQKSSETREVRETEAMIGDVNIFYEPSHDGRGEGEVEIMIAESWARGKGCGREALCAMLRFGQEFLHTERFTSKIGYDNKASLKLFKKLGFQEISRSDVFKEVTLEFDASSHGVFNAWTPGYCVETIK
ncbi:N-acetyltransferase 9-like protein isoform X2 [Aplysia californica]|nr:N-acetyltransferase 9-like protein isoform X2 [Aplysia californica]